MPMTADELLTPEDIAQRLNWPLGKATRLARQRRLPFTLLPDGSVRFCWQEVEALLVHVPTTAALPC